MGEESWDDASTALRPRFDPSPATLYRYALTVVEGPDAGRTWEFDAAQPNRVLLGTSPSCDIRLGDRSVSRRHVAIAPEGELLRVTDLDSKNGTLVNGVAIIEARLTGNELLQVGATRLQLARRERSESAQLSTATRFGRLLGASTEMRRLYPLCERLAQSRVPVLIEGETGTGKELLAEAIHEVAMGEDKPFVVFDCTAVPPSLVESELYGHEAGAFTGAVARRQGVFEQAHGGSLLIDEIGELDLQLQPKLLRVLERGEVRRVGGTGAIAVEVRIIAATRRDLDREVQLGRFRDDLFHRLAVGRIELPPLRRRRGDVPLLARHFARELAGDDAKLSPSALAFFEDSPWPGNVRELRNAVARYLALGELHSARTQPPPESDHFEEVLRMRLPYSEARKLAAETFQRRYLERALAEHGGNVTNAARACGIARRYFHMLRARSQKG